MEQPNAQMSMSKTNNSSQSPFDCTVHSAQDEKYDSLAGRKAAKVDKVDSIPRVPQGIKAFVWSGF